MSISATGLNGSTVNIQQERIEQLAGSVRGEVALPGTAGYEDARTLWNAMIDKRPALVVRCSGAHDVAHAVRFAADQRLLVAVRGAGHNIAGLGLCDGGLLIDLSRMKAVHVDVANRVARAQPGATLGDLDHETQAFGLATPTGINSTTGIAGLTLGGGFGWLSRKHGMTIDNLRSVDIVTADGRMIRASATESPDLFWAVRGGGGNFGVVTSFEFDLHPVGPEVLSGLVVHPLSAGAELLPFYRSFTAELPDAANVWIVLRKAPPLPFLAPEVHGTDVIVLAACYAGDIAEGERVLKPLRDFGSPHADIIGPMPYSGWQAAFDPLLTPGARNYWKSHNFAELSDELIAVVLDYAGRLPSGQSEIFFAQLGGAMSRVASDATAYAHRASAFTMNVHTRWDAGSDDARCVTWAREFFEATAPHADGSVYSNFIPEDENRVSAAYGANYARLAAIKRQYDPGNLFRVNQNITP